MRKTEMYIAIMFILFIMIGTKLNPESNARKTLKILVKDQAAIMKTVEEIQQLQKEIKQLKGKK